MRVLIGLVGLPRAGKKTFTQELSRLFAPRSQISQIDSRELADEMSVEEKRQLILSIPEEVAIFILRKETDIELVRNFPHIFVYIDTPTTVRWRCDCVERRREKKSILAFYEFEEAEKSEHYSFLRWDFWKNAEDVERIYNDSSLSRLRGHIARFMRHKLVPMLRS